MGQRRVHGLEILIILGLIYILYSTSKPFKLGLQYTRFCLVLYNFIRLLPFGVPLTRTILILINSFRFWLGILILAFNFNLIFILINFTPPRSPPILVPVLVLIELVSNIARPISLSVRIIANISCRHLLLFLCRNLILILRSSVNIFTNYMSAYLSVLTYILVLWGFVVFENGVIFIQAYVYFILRGIYFGDINLS